MRFRFSGHESFICRYTWLPKAFKAISTDSELFKDDNKAMVVLGVGKNMVRSIKFWAQVFDIIDQKPNTQEMVPTEFGRRILSPEGLDPFLEDSRTLWLLHWQVASNVDEPLFAWYFLLNQWIEPTFSRSEAVSGFTAEAERLEKPLSEFTKTNHFDIFLKTYLPSKVKSGDDVLEDSLDCPLTELQFIRPAGERVISENGRREPIFEFNTNNKAYITGELFAFCLFEYWKKNRSQETTVSFRDISVTPGSPGHIFKIQDSDLRNYLDEIYESSNGMFEFKESAVSARIIKHKELNDVNWREMLDNIYRRRSSKTAKQKPSRLHA